ncbi:MAG: TetR/AcrR family transcriptional regulator [Erysipelotrichaceae bacterium]|nr:TetR/AcrR family transcriptional regulator [Erysipelotrichaceae bacterium]MBQ1810497.1 TetR/AcrR family transcriptional regulator [Erysipelotrichaceae bacterium]MBR3151546.1 TetR/AcrR family transcriptional regulator [Erysipelotrichaceae bacterium]
MTTDRRVIRTKLAIRDAFIRLLATKDYDEITVNEILEFSYYSKPTFYKHYSGKTDLVNKIMEDTLSALDTVITRYKAEHAYVWNSRDILAFNEARFMHIYENRELYKALFTYPCFALFPRYLQDYIDRLEVPYELLPRSDIRYIEYFNSSMAHIFTGTIYYWIRENFTSSPKRIAEMYSYTFCIDEEN